MTTLLIVANLRNQKYTVEKCTIGSLRVLENEMLVKGASIHDRVLGRTVLHVCALLDWRELAADLLRRGMGVDVLVEQTAG